MLLKREQSLEEWYVWRFMCEQLRQRGIDVNDKQHDVLCRSIRVWGELHRQLFAHTTDTYAQFPMDRDIVMPLVREYIDSGGK